MFNTDEQCAARASLENAFDRICTAINNTDYEVHPVITIRKSKQKDGTVGFTSHIKMTVHVFGSAFTPLPD